METLGVIVLHKFLDQVPQMALAEYHKLPQTVLVHRQSPVKDGYFAHAIPGQIDSPKMRLSIASEMPVT
jgi:hypothetical protein